MTFVGARYVRALFLIGFVALFSMVFIPPTVSAGEVNLAWNPSTSPDIAGYRIHYGVESRNYDQIMDAGNSTSCVVSGLEQGQTYYFAATAVNTANLESVYSNEVSIALSTTNQPPVANAGPDQDVNGGATVTLSGRNSVDPEGRPLTYSWSQVSGTTVSLSNPSAAQTTFIAPSVGSRGKTLGFQLTVTDSGGLQSSDTCIVNVVQVTQSPVANAGLDQSVNVTQSPVANAGPDQSVNEGRLVTLNGSGSSDPDGSPLTYEWVQTSGTPVALSSDSVAQPTFLAPSVGPNGETLTFQLTVTSGGLLARGSCIVTVVWVDQPPVANAGSDQSVNRGASVTLDGTGTKDPDGETLSYYWLQTRGTPVTLSNPMSVQPTFVAPTVRTTTTLVFSLTATDPEDLSSSDQCSVVVNGGRSRRGR
jgi:hypothetical protein